MQKLPSLAVPQNDVLNLCSKFVKNTHEEIHLLVKLDFEI